MADTETLATGPDRDGRAPWHARLRQRLQAERLRDLPLRVRLVAILTALALVALAITGALAVTLLRRELIGRVDAQVRSIAMTARHDGRIPMTSPGGDRHGRLPTTTFGAVRVDTGSFYTDTDRLDSPYGSPAVRDLQPAEVARHHDQPFTVRAENGAGRWRVVALRVDTTEGPGTLIVGQSLEDVDETVARMTIVLLVVGLGVLVAVGLLGGLVVRRELRPLTEVEDVAEQIAGGDLSRRVPDHPTSTEVGRLSASLNAMLSQIEQSFAVRAASQERMRRFVSDASHELRTPLAAVRGYAELYRQGAVREPEQVAGAMRRIEDEATRMGGLVEDLLTLARLDEQRRDRRTPVDLTVLAADAVQDARALDAGREVRLVPLGGALGPVVVDGDEPRLRQVVTNLVANALRHTPPGSPIELAVGLADGEGLLEVRDHGPGIPPEQAVRVFERFFRADASRQRGKGGGSGLGLAIVAAIVAAHEGRVGVTQTPGGGATFVVQLPLRAPSDSVAEPEPPQADPDDLAPEPAGASDGRTAAAEVPLDAATHAAPEPEVLARRGRD